MAGIFEKTVVHGDGLDMLAEETGERSEPNFYPVNLDLEGLMITGLRVKTLSKEQIEAQKSTKGQTIGFVDVQIAGRLWVSGLKIFRNRRKQSMLLNPSTYSEKQQKWFTTVFFTSGDREKILEEARRVAREARQQRLAQAQ